MDFTKLHNLLLFLASGLSPEDLTRQYKLYFDETNNAKMFHLKDDNRLNVPVGVRFEGDRGQAPVPKLKISNLHVYSIICQCKGIVA